MEEKRIRIAITQGDTNAIGYELIFKTFASPEMLDVCTPIIYGSPKAATYHCKNLGLKTNFSIISKAQDAREGRVNLLACIDEMVKIEFGKPTPDSARAALTAIDQALADYRKDLYDALIIAPMDSRNITVQGIPFRGAANYVEAFLGGGQRVLPVYISDHLRVALHTSYIPLREVPAAVTTDNVSKSVMTFYNALQRDLRISTPRVAMLALNPHADGEEEKDVLQPLISSFAGDGVNIFGPFVATSFFANNDASAFDGVLAMYFDQGLLPLNIYTPKSAFCLLTGAPLVCVLPNSTDCFADAGKGVAETEAFRQAIYAAIDIYRNRVCYDTFASNPLQTLYHEKRDEGEHKGNPRAFKNFSHSLTNTTRMNNSAN